MTEIKYRGEETLKYKTADFSELKYIKVIYTDVDGNSHEVKTSTNFMSDDYISLSVKKVQKKEEDDEAEITEVEPQESKSYSTEDYLAKLAEIKSIKEEAEITGKFDEYYKKLEEIQNLESQPSKRADEVQADTQNEDNEVDKNIEGNKFNVNCPQPVMLKFVFNEILYVSHAQLVEVHSKGSKVIFKLKAPDVLRFQQHRRFYRINLKRLCVLIASNSQGSSDVFVARSINLSAGGVLINRLETISQDNKFVSINPEDYEAFNLILVIELEKVLKLSARYVRQEEGAKSWRYGFEFINISKDKIDFINKYVIGKQISKLREKFDLKNKKFRA